MLRPVPSQFPLIRRLVRLVRPFRPLRPFRPFLPLRLLPVLAAAPALAPAQHDPAFQATLEPLPAPSSPADPPRQAILRCPANPFYRYSLQRSSSLAADSWITILPRPYAAPSNATAASETVTVQLALPTGVSSTTSVVSNRTTPGTSNPIETTTTITIDNLRPKGTCDRDLVADSSCAVTRTSGNGIVIPDAASVHVVGQAGNWSAIDQVSSTETGGVYHIDLYKGFDRAAADLISADTEVILLDY